MTRESAIKKCIWQFAIAYAIILLILVREEVVGNLSPRAMGIIALLFAAAGWIFLLASFLAINRRYQPTPVSNDPAARKAIVRGIRILRFFIILWPLNLIYCLWDSRGGPLLPRVAGTAGNLCLTWLFLRALRAQKAKLEELEVRE